MVNIKWLNLCMGHGKKIYDYTKEDVIVYVPNVLNVDT